MKDERCGCCEGVEKLTPLPVANRPGLSTLAYRVGTHPTFLETMKACLTGWALEVPAADGTSETIYPLRGLTTRESDDPAIALLDAWATVADVLTFYQERIANEGYLLTATERRSVLELARLVGYELRPGVASTVYLAFTLEDGYEIEIPAGTGARSVPDPGELPQVFETLEAIQARTEWNAIEPRLSRPQYLTSDSFEGRRELVLKGVLTNLKANDPLLFLCGVADGEQVFESPSAYRVDSLETDPELDLTSVSYRTFRATGSGAPPVIVSSTRLPSTTATPGRAAAQPALARLGSVVSALKKEPSLPPASRFQLDRPAEQTFGASAELGPQLLVHLHPILRDTLYTAYAKAPAALSPATLPCRVEALRVKASPFGHNAPQNLVYDDDNVLVGRREWGLMELGRTLRVDLTSTTGGSVIDAFNGFFSLTGNDFPALEVTVSIADESGAVLPAVSRELRGLDPVPPSGGANPVFRAELAFSDASSTRVTIEAGYNAPAADDNGEYDDARLSGFRVTVGQPGRITTVFVVPTVFDATVSRLQVHLDGDPPRTLDPGDEINETIENRTLTLALNGSLLVSHRTPALSTQQQLRTVWLDSTYDEIQPGSWVVIDRADLPQPRFARVESVRTLSRADYGISGKVTQLVLDTPWLNGTETSLAVLRGTSVFAQSEALELAETRIQDDIAGSTLELDGLYDGLKAGRWLVVSGERTDLPYTTGEEGSGVQASELVMLAGVLHDVRRVTDPQGNEIELPGDTLHTTLTLAEPLAYTYKRDTVRVNANVAKASHGETVREVLGAGDGSKPLQTFTLKKPPLTYLSAPNPSGVQSTLEVRVNDVQWHETSSLVWLQGHDRGFVTQRDNEENTTVTFGDGRHGARPPTGVENVKSVYRSGIGEIGNASAGQISQLASKPLGVKEVVNPIGAAGGADPEGRDQARRNAPLAVTSLDRIVSTQDYADFARTFSGIGTASAIRLSDGRRQVVHLTIAGAGDIPIEPYSDLYRNLSRALYEHGDPHQPVQIDEREAKLMLVNARVRVLSDYLWESVEPQIRVELLDTFSFEQRELGRDVLLSEVISAIQGVQGVAYVDVDLLDSISESEAEDVEELAAKLEALAGGAAARPRHRIVVEAARIDDEQTDPGERIRPAQLAYLSPDLPDTLILTELKP